MLRFVASALTGMLIVGLLFFGLDYAISLGHRGEPPEAPARIEFTSLMRAKAPEPKKRVKPAPREKPKIDPTAIALASSTSTERANSPIKMELSSSLLSDSGGGGPGSVTAGDVDAGRSGGFIGGRSDRGLMPLVRVEPDYPESASHQKIEGYVIVEFTVTASGTVRDPQVLHAEPTRVFDEAARKAVLRWRYSPQVENGVAVEKQVRMRIAFKLDDGGRS
jgi:protein TonB